MCVSTRLDLGWNQQGPGQPVDFVRDFDSFYILVDVLRKFSEILVTLYFIICLGAMLGRRSKILFAISLRSRFYVVVLGDSDLIDISEIPVRFYFEHVPYF